MATRNDIQLDEKDPIESIPTELDLKIGEVKGLDQAEIFLRENNITHTDLTTLLEDEQATKKLMRRVDWTLMPLLCGTCKNNEDQISKTRSDPACFPIGRRLTSLDRSITIH